MSIIIEPITANVMNAVMCGLMSFGLLMTPQKFMQGGQYQSPWFANLPEERDNRLYYLGQFMAFVMLSGGVIPVLIQPDSQFLCYQMAVVHGLNLVHTFIFLCSNVYARARPTSTASLCQWVFVLVASVWVFTATVLASIHDTDNIVDSGETYISKQVANIAMLAFSSFFGLLFVSVPKYLLSGFWSDEDAQGGDDFCGFRILHPTDHELWWSRCIGLAILGLNLGVAVDTNISQPLYTISSLIVLSCLTLFNFHQVIMRPYRSISTYQIGVSWVPNIMMSGVMIGVLVSAILYK